MYKWHQWVEAPFEHPVEEKGGTLFLGQVAGEPRKRAAGLRVYMGLGFRA